MERSNRREIGDEQEEEGLTLLMSILVTGRSFPINTTICLPT